ncbi:mannonate dehydratase [Rhizobium sp. VS19-DR104.2]|uniref:mannonate dehydratase n=1 Tax=unclassified Rhizobium TaxID=2613769 RepID=UPI001CC6837D|nr:MULTISPECIES: mannonate dehydratase [unclassified Rhizobium]MBZ5763154.1 mannonate dehydratase [Rhizobium sp. VS19-DR96]MBZ5769070.1 mannonate dehydratase [Rhizobium sp. VS19-DR129.2]MBZ5776641.1 mannonate dehydratase [Rhizobium sp. VS19-DRK62.2]MBZ5787773.1 mannonate dehydratase [Rhizobium sp. VS19-DR121]MBZ5805139.1 mannonate dehydratase [Rhizobium sp. VS19-DR181]
MRHTWRWFGPIDKVSVRDAAQAGAQGIVSALHHVPTGTAWTAEDVAKRQSEIRAGGLEWELVESIPISESIKTMSGDWKAHVEAWKETLRILAAAGIFTVCYNFMPVLDWTRTDLRWETPSGARAMRFDLIDFVAFDIHVLQRPAAALDYSPDVIAQAKERYQSMSDEKKEALSRNIGAGLPGSSDGYGLGELREALSGYASIDAKTLRANLITFLSEVVPLAEELGMRLCAHGDDPPWALLGLPRILSTEADYVEVLEAVDSLANGVTFCTGSLGVRADNDLPAMVKRLAPRIHFVHLRNVRREDETTPCSFFEDEHLEGNTDMVAVIAAIVAEENRRRTEGRADHQIFMRPDHGQEILDDLTRGAQPGYPAIGRLKGLAELRGIERTLSHATYGLV